MVYTVEVYIYIRKFYGDLNQQYQVSLSRMLKWHSDPSSVTVTADHTFKQFHDLDTELDLHRFKSAFHKAFATRVACQQGKLTFPDTWSRSYLDLLLLQLLRPVSPLLPCLFSTFQLAYPSALFCFEPLYLGLSCFTYMYVFLLMTTFLSDPFMRLG